MHLATPVDTSFRSYVAGGARSVVASVDDTKLMQEMAGNFMKGEARKGVEAPQNYGFTSVVMDADRDATGKATAGAEGFVMFCGGNRTFPVATVIDDRRHRLRGLAKGDVAMYRTAADQLQFHLAESGAYWTAPTSQKLRLALVAPATSPGNGQTAQYQQASTQSFEVNGTMTQSVNARHQTVLEDMLTGVEVNPDGNVYLGAIKGAGTFRPVMLSDGTPARNVLALKSIPMRAVSADVAAVRAKVEAAIAPLGITLADLAAALGL
jgi:phage gp45-like